MSVDERYEDCDRCDERFVGEEAIRNYLRDVEVPPGTHRVCVGCLEAQAKKRAAADTARTKVCKNIGYHREGWTCRVCGETE